jgi:hypothetical protein
MASGGKAAKKKGKQTAIEAGKDLVGPVAAGGVALVTGSPTAAAIALGSGLGVAFVRRFLDAIGSHRERAAEKFVAMLVAVYPDKSPEEIAGLLEARLEEDPKAADAVYASLRAILDKPSAAVAVAVGLLCAEYLQEEREPDAFFRGVARVLVDATSSEFEELKGLFAKLAELVPDDDVARAHVGTTTRHVDQIVISGGDASGPTRDERDATSNVVQWKFSDARRLVALLRTNGLAHDGVAQGLSMWDEEKDPLDKTHWDWALQIDARVVHRVHRIIRSA